ncbi:hypothetical protein K439DRAFT_1617531 [Ramaria rubella]|nr:hypothetical protein K439DRAFT_1617531 [Ramaria rubella]
MHIYSDSYSLLLKKISPHVANAPASATISSSSPFGDSKLPSLSQIQAPLDQANYQKVCFWTHADYETYKDELKIAGTSTGSYQSDGTRACKTLVYITDFEGIGINGFTARAICSTAPTIWNTVAVKGCTPETWMLSHTTTCQYYHKTMYENYLYLAACKEHWNVNMLVNDKYPGWTRNHKDLVAQGNKVKHKEMCSQVIAPPIVCPSKKMPQ